MSQTLSLSAFFNKKTTRQAAARSPEMLRARKDFGKLLTIANGVFNAPACQLSVFDQHQAHGIAMPALRLSYPNGAKLELFDNFRTYAISITSPDKDVPQQFLKDAYCPHIDWHTLYRPGMPEEMAYTTYLKNPRQFTFKTNDREPKYLQNLVLGFSWLQKQSMGLTQAPAQQQQARPEKAAAIVLQPQALTV